MKPVIKTLARLSSDKTHGLDSRKAAFTDSANEITDGEVNLVKRRDSQDNFSTRRACIGRSID